MSRFALLVFVFFACITATSRMLVHESHLPDSARAVAVHTHPAQASGPERVY